MSILFSPEAEADFQALVAYLKERNPAAARRLAERIFAVIDLLAAGDIEGAER